jgi:hypothetical protein
MSCALTQNYVLDCRDSRGGSKEFHIMEFENLTSFTLTAGVVSALVKLTAKKFWKYAQVKQTSEADEAITPNEENGTVFSKQTVKIVLNKRQASVRNEIMLLAKNRLVIVEIDQNGAAWIYGLTNGLLMAPSQVKSGKAFGDRNGYELVFEGFEPEAAYSVDPTVVSALETPGP